MKLNAAVLKSLLMAASIGTVVPLGAQSPAKPSPKPAAPAEEPAKVQGLEVARANGAYLGVSVEGVRLVVRFYDKDKKPAAPDAARGAARWNPVNKAGEVRSPLNPGTDGFSLASNPVVKPPLVFKVYLTLLDAGDKEIESLVVDMRRFDPKQE